MANQVCFVIAVYSFSSCLSIFAFPLPIYLRTTHGDPKRWANFRLPEIESLAEMAGIDPASVFDREAAVKQNSAFVHVNLPSLHQAKIMSDRAVLIQ